MKRFLKILASIIGVFIILIGGLFVFRESLVIAYMSPPRDFSAETAPKAPDYADEFYWVAHPNKDETSDIRFAGQAPADPEKAPIDVFYVHPTTYYGPGDWNSTMDIAEAHEQNLETMLGGHGSLFNDCCRFYAPRYRQAHIGVFVRSDDESADETRSFKALDVAYEDVERAFDYYLTHLNKGRPFILAGHSQGSLHMFRLLETRIDGTALQRQLVAAYPIGFWFPEDKLTRGLVSVELCIEPEATGCFVTYDTYGDAGPGRDLTGKMPHWYKTGWEWVGAERTLCVNPISWRSNTDRAEQVDHKGGMPLKPTIELVDVLLNRNSGLTYEVLAQPMPNLTWAKCDDNGTLFVATQRDNVFAGGIDETQMYHTYDWQLFYMDIKANVEARIASYISRYKAEGGEAR